MNTKQTFAIAAIAAVLAGTSPAYAGPLGDIGGLGGNLGGGLGGNLGGLGGAGRLGGTGAFDSRGDLNGAFADGHRSGILVEDLTIASLIHTISANTPGILRVRILVDGKERETLAGHADLSEVYDVTAVNQLSSQLASAQ